MRALRLATFVAASLTVPAVASAQVTTFICTPDGQVLKQIVNANGTSGGTSVWYTGAKTDVFYGCKVGPDGWLYLTSGSTVQRLRLDVPTSNGAASTIAMLPSAGREIAFNVTTLYVNTATSGIQTLVGVRGSTDPLSFPNPATQLFAVSPSDGHGIAFDVLGNLVLSSGAQVLRAKVNLQPPFYTNAPSSVLSSGATVFATAVNTCGQIIYADRQSRSVKGRAKDNSDFTVATFPDTLDYPIGISIDSNKNIYVTTVQSDAGHVAKIWRIAGSLENACAAASPTMVVDLSALLSGPGKVKGLKSARAFSIAAAPTDASLTRTFTEAQCSNLYDFGYHTTRLTFDNCTVPFTLTIDALKSKPSDVTFAGDIPVNAEHVPYSPLDGFATQLRFNDPVGVSGPVVLPTFSAQFGFYAQVLIGKPGVGRTADDSVTAPYTEDVLTDFWDLAVDDAAAGTREAELSKRVVFNTPLSTTAIDCTVKAQNVGQPLNKQQPLFKLNQNVFIQYIPTTLTGEPCGAGGTIRVSVARIDPAPITLLLAKSSGNAQTENIMANSGDSFSFNLDTKGFGTGLFQLTFSGDTVASFSLTFRIQQ